MSEAGVSRPGPPLGGWAAYQEAEVLEAEPRGLVHVVHQAAGSGHHDVSQAAEAVHPAEQRALSRGPTAPDPAACGQGHTGLCPPAPASPGPMPSRTYVFWTRLSCSLASDFCPVTRATRRGVASV